MPSPIILETWEALATRSAFDYSSGYSGLNMEEAIYKGRFVEAPAVPSVYIGFISQTQQNGTTLTRYQGSMVFQLYCFTSGSNNYERTKKAVQLGADIQNRILEDRTLGLTAGRVDNIGIQSTAVDGDRYGFNQLGICILEATIDFVSDRGL
jgi:hypothetical protein